MFMNKIYGIGTDIVQVNRMRNILEKSIKNRFLNKVLHPLEIDQLQQKPDIQMQSQFLASRWAYKEALVKALSDRSLIFPEVQLYREKEGRPILKFEGYNLEILKSKYIIEHHVSISHEQEFAIAYVMLITSNNNQ